MQGFLDWFTGGEFYNYHNLFMCMDNDFISITLVVALCVAVIAGYGIIAYRWSKAASDAPESEAKKALRDLKWIFIFCAICGYLFVVIKMVWPAWRLFIFFLVALNYFTWSYVTRLDAMERIYKYLKDRDDLVKEIDSKQQEIDELLQAQKQQ